MSRWMIQLGVLVEPMINQLRAKILEGPVVHSDETPIQVLKEAGKSVGSKSYMWVMARGARGEKAVVFNYDAGRSRRVAIALFAGYRGYLQSDGYAGYNILKGAGGVIRVGCWAHARRKFVDALKCAPRGGEGTVASAAVKMIKKLYEIERGIGEAPTEERFLVRQKISKPILDEMRRWLDKNIAEVLPKSLTGKALGYLNNEWENLAR